jgi:hypothetical protein
VIGTDNESGSALSPPSGLLGVDDVAAGLVVVDAVFGAVVVVAFGAVVVVVVESFDVADETGFDDVAAPADPRPVNTLAAASARAPVITAIEVRGFRLKVLLLLCIGYTDPL